MSHIHLKPLGIELACPLDSRLIDLLDEVEDTRVLAGLPLSCRGARCGVCRVRIAQGHAAVVAPSLEERDALRAMGAAEDERLACQLHVRADPEQTIELTFTALTTAPRTRD